jgi:signal peptidase I
MGTTGSAPQSAGRAGFWIDIGIGAAIAVVVGVVLKTFVLGAVQVPTASMRATLLPGDFILVNKLQRQTRIGDVIVVHPPACAVPGSARGDVLFVKRCIATGGDTVEFRPRGIAVNQKPLFLPGTAAFWADPESGFKNDAGKRIIVPTGSLFLLGDNPSESSDSRAWGCIPASDVVGGAVAVYWSVSPEGPQSGRDHQGGVRWERIGTIIR